MSKHLVFTVTNALNYDQRMQRICTSLVNAGYRVTLVGWSYPESPILGPQAFEQVRLPMKNRSGKWRYIEYNYKLLSAIKKLKPDLIGAIDLDTILPCYYIAKQLKVPIIYDAHEYFTELEEVVRRPFTHWIWKKVEAFAVPRIKYGYAVNDSYVKLFNEKYGVSYEVIRNATVLKPLPEQAKSEPYILYQGAVNEGRALKQLITAMHQVDCPLIICGKGDLYESLQAYTAEQGLTHKVQFKGFVLPADLVDITRKAHIGITLFETSGLSNYYSLANRFFDYMHAGVPQLCNAYPEYIRINGEFELANLIEKPDVASIAAGLNRMLQDADYYHRLCTNALKARETYNWQAEELKLVRLYKHIFEAH